MVITPLHGIGDIQKNDPISKLVLQSLENNKIHLRNNDILVITQKIVSKSEGRLISLAQYYPSERAMSIAKVSGKDPRFVEAILQESKEIVRVKEGTIIAEHKLGFICANAGIDHSNVKQSDMNMDVKVLLLPENPDRSANLYKQEILKATGKHIGILIIDSHGRAWRNGAVGMAIGLAGVPAIVDKRGDVDLFGNTLRVTQIAAADQLAAAASLVMGEADEGTPVVHVRGFPYNLRESSMKELIRDKSQDLFR